MKKCPFCGEEAHFSKKKNCWVCVECEKAFAEPLDAPEDPAGALTDEQLLSTKTSAPMKIFLSYAHAQSAVVESIMAGLTARGHKVWFDETQIRHGDEWRKKITDGILDSKGVLSFLSREAIRDQGVCLDELGIAVGVRYGCLRTVLLHREKDLQPIPAQLTHRQWLDMSDWEDKFAQGTEVYSAWFREKLAAIIRMVESDESREFEGQISMIRKRMDISDTAISRQGWYLQQPFVGREWLTNRVSQWLDDPNGGHLCAVYGGPGTGKSAFAAHYAYRSPRVAASLFFEHGNKDFNSPDAIARELMFQLACRIPSYRSQLVYTLQTLPENQPINVQELFERLVAVPLRHTVNGGYETQCVVIDGLDECGRDGQRLAVQLLREQRFPSWLRVLVLCRPESGITGMLKTDLEINITADSTANSRDIRAYYSRRLEKRLEARPDRDALLDALMGKSQGVFLYAYIVTDMILHDKLTLDELDAYPRDLNASFDAWFSRYFPDEREYGQFYRLPLGVIAACEDPVPLEELEISDGYYDVSAHCFRLREPQADERRERVARRLEICAPLLKYGKNAFGRATVSFTHRYLSEWLSRAVSDYSCAPADAMWALEQAWRKRLEANQPMTEYQALHLLSAMEKAGEPEETIRAAAANGEWEDALVKYYKQYDSLIQWNLSLLFAGMDAKRCKWAYGPEHPDTLTAMDNLALTYSALGRHTEALELNEQVYEARKRVLGPEHPHTLTAMNNLAYTYSYLGIYAEALKLEEQVYEARKRVLGPEHPHTLTAIGNLAYTYSALGGYAEALEMNEQVYEASKRVLGPEHPDTLLSMGNLAYTYSYLGRHAEALELLKQEYEAMKRVLGPEHPHTLLSMGNLAYTYSYLGKYDKALELQEQVYEAMKRVLGPEHPHTLMAMNNLAYTYSCSSRYSEALKLNKRVYEAMKRVLGPEHPHTLTAMGNLADTYSKLGCHSEALEMQEQVYEASKRVLGPEHPDTLRAMNNLADTYSKLGCHSEALEMQEQVYEASKRVLGPEHPVTLTAMGNLAAAYSNLGRHAAALDLRKQIYEARKRAPGPAHPESDYLGY